MSAVRLAPRRPICIALVLIALIVLGCSNSSDLSSAFIRRFGVPPTSTPAPPADSPAGAVKLLQWCWESRNLAHYGEALGGDFIFAFGVTDPAGDPYAQNPWTREDELVSAGHIFDAASSITLDLAADLTPQPDSRPGKSYPWHQQVEVPNLTLTVFWKDGSASRITGGGLFFMARGDSALIPDDLIDRGFKPDMNRWYIERWEDQTDVGGGIAFGGSEAAPSRSLPAHKPTWGALKVLYR